ncbi:MAG: helix-turn-helix domain-containing protein [Longimicrobiales bacterium]
MEKRLFEALLESANEALAHAQGRLDLRTTVLPPPPEPMRAHDVQRLRRRMDASQAVFAGYLNVSKKLVQAWEAGRRTPNGASLRLLRLAERAPELLLNGAREIASHADAAAGPRSPALRGRTKASRQRT